MNNFDVASVHSYPIHVFILFLRSKKNAYGMYNLKTLD